MTCDRRKRIAVALAICGWTSLLSGCGGGGGDGGAGGGGATGGGVAISGQLLSGKIGGQAWTVGTAASDAFLSTADRYFVTMYAATFAACESFAAPSGVDEFIVELPSKPGSYSLGLASGQTATFYQASTSFNHVATKGRIVIDTVTATTISGGANVTFDAANFVDGQFQVSICP
jgi:hypothetical protein